MRVHQHPPDPGLPRRPRDDPQARQRGRPALPRPQRRLHPHPQARHRAPATAPRWPASNSSDLDRGPSTDDRAAHSGLRDGPSAGTVRKSAVVAYDGGAGFTGSPPTPACARSPATLTEAISTVVRPGRHSPAPGAPTPACTPGVRWSPSTSRPASISPTSPAGSTSSARRRSPCVGRVGRRRLRRPLLGARGGTTATTCGTPRTPNPLLAARAWHVPRRSPRGRCTRRAEPADRRARLRLVLPPAQGADEGGARAVASCATCSSPAGQVADDATAPLLRFEIRANAFCHQMVRSIVGTLVDVGTGKLPPATCRRSSLPATAAAGQVAPPQGLTLWEVGY